MVWIYHCNPRFPCLNLSVNAGKREFSWIYLNSLSRKMKENARKLLAKVGITRSFPNGKRSVNAGIHAIFLDSAVFTVSENAGKRPQKAGFHSLTAVNSRFSRLKTQGKCRNTRRSPSVNRSVNVSKRMFTGVHWIGKLMDNGTNTRINRSENVWKTKDFPLGESQKMRVNCAFFVNSPHVFSVRKCHFFCRGQLQLRFYLTFRPLSKQLYNGLPLTDAF